MSGPRDRRILLCSDHLPPSDGGVEQVVAKLARHLRDEGFTVGIFTLDDGTRTFDLRDERGITLYTADGTDLTDLIGLQSMISLPAIPAFRRVLADFDPDVVHAHNRYFYTTAVAAMYSLSADYRLVTTLHLGDVGMISGLGGAAARAYEQTIGRFVLARSDRVICVSRAVEAVAHDLGATETSVIRNAVDVEAFTPSRTAEKSLLYIGRLVRNNGVQDLLEAVPGLLEAHPDATVHIVGSGPLEDETRTAVARLGTAVNLHEYVEDITTMYDRASVFCRPSYSEGLPLTLLEAMASGVPPVVTSIAGVPEVVTDYENGRLLEPGRPAAIQQAIVELFDDESLRSSMAQHARDYVVENLTWEQRTNKVLAVYDQVQ